MKNKKLIYICSVIFTGLCIFYISNSQIANTKHNLSTSGSGTYKASTESEICIYCHTPHAAAKTPLWNRSDPGTNYTLYSSSTLNANVSQPDGSSLMCLSCHDGSIALGSVKSRSSNIAFSSNYITGATNLGSSLDNDHPVSFVYNTDISNADADIKSPSQIDGATKLDNNNKMQCTSCHDPHYTSNIKFLVERDEYSTLCYSCHQKSYWSNSTHKTSTRTWNNSGTNPWHTSYTTVERNACANCHTSHNAGGSKRLLNSSSEENNCLYCHNGNVATTNINSQLSKTYKHNVAGYTGTHDPVENNIVSTMHSECVDCHNPHASNSSTASAPNVNGSLLGVRGIDTDGNTVNPSSYEYQICYRCHTTSSGRPASRTTRQISQNNVALEFDTGNPSFHPIEGARNNTQVPSLLTGYSSTSVIYCSTCHASDGTSSPKGPHGSTIQALLKSAYSTSDPQTYSATNSYLLCFSCHSRTSIMNDASFIHNLHVNDENTPCNTCHDPHGINSAQGNSTNNKALINFNTSVVSARNGVLRYQSTGQYRGNCTLICHGESHNGYSYQR